MTTAEPTNYRDVDCVSFSSQKIKINTEMVMSFKLYRNATHLKKVIISEVRRFYLSLSLSPSDVSRTIARQ